MTEYNHWAIMVRELIGVKHLETKTVGFAFAQLLFSLGAWVLYYFYMKSIITRKRLDKKERKRKHPVVLGMLYYAIFVGVISFYFGVFYQVCAYKKGYEMLWFDWYLRFVLTGFVLTFLGVYISILNRSKKGILSIIFGIFLLCLLPYAITDSLLSTGKMVPYWVRKLTNVISYVSLPGNCAYTRPLSKDKIICYMLLGVVIVCAIVIKWKQQTVKEEE